MVTLNVDNRKSKWGGGGGGGGGGSPPLLQTGLHPLQDSTVISGGEGRCALATTYVGKWRVIICVHMQVEMLVITTRHEYTCISKSQ